MSSGSEGELVVMIFILPHGWAISASRRQMVIVMDNVSVHIHERVTQLIESEGHLVRYLPPYSPDFNPIELTFSVLKAWMKCNWVFLRLSNLR